MMAVFQRLELSLFERLLGAVTEDSTLQLVAFVNQPPGISESVAYSGESVHLFRSFYTPLCEVGGRVATDAAVSGGPLNSPPSETS